MTILGLQIRFGEREARHPSQFQERISAPDTSLPIWANPILANPFLAILVLGHIQFGPNPIWAFFNLGQSNLGQNQFGPKPIWAKTHLGQNPLLDLVCAMVELRRGGGPKFRAFFPSPAPFSLFVSLGVFSWNFCGVFEAPDPQMCTFGVLCRVKPRRPKTCRLHCCLCSSQLAMTAKRSEEQSLSNRSSRVVMVACVSLFRGSRSTRQAPIVCVCSRFDVIFCFHCAQCDYDM